MKLDISERNQQFGKNLKQYLIQKCPLKTTRNVTSKFHRFKIKLIINKIYVYSVLIKSSLNYELILWQLRLILIKNKKYRGPLQHWSFCQELTQPACYSVPIFAARYWQAYHKFLKYNPAQNNCKEGQIKPQKTIGVIAKNNKV